MRSFTLVNARAHLIPNAVVTRSCQNGELQRRTRLGERHIHHTVGFLVNTEANLSVLKVWQLQATQVDVGLIRDVLILNIPWAVRTVKNELAVSFFVKIMSVVSGIDGRIGALPRCLAGSLTFTLVESIQLFLSSLTELFLAQSAINSASLTLLLLLSFCLFTLLALLTKTKERHCVPFTHYGQFSTRT